ncbi:MAG: potassium channel family protein [Candidatus Nanopelagicales bacterium]
MGNGSSALFQAVAAEERLPRRLLVAVLARVLGVVGVVLLVYLVVPIGGESATAATVTACVGIAAVLTVFARQISRVSRSPRPVLAALEALALVFGLFLCFFALLYVSLSVSDPGAFTQAVTKVAGIYFTMTVFATVGFGDIAADSDTARVMVTIQMVLGMILIGTAVKALGSAARRGSG